MIEGDVNRKMRDRLITNYEKCNMDVETEEEFMVLLDKVVPDDEFNEEVVFEPDDINGGKINGNKTPEENKVEKDDTQGNENEGRNTKKLIENEKLEKSKRKRESESEEVSVSPTKKKGRNSLPKRITRKNLLDKAKDLKDYNKKYKKAISKQRVVSKERCMLCCTSDPPEDTNDNKDEFVLVQICMECFEVLNDAKALEELRELVRNKKASKKDNTDKDEEQIKYICGVCILDIKRSPAILCTTCKNWIHIKCSGFDRFKTAKDNKHSFVCTPCVKKNENQTEIQKPENVEEKEKSKNILEYKGININKDDLATLSEGKGFNDVIISFATEKLQQSSKDQKIMVVNPIVTQFIKNSTDEKDIANILEKIGIRSKDWALFIINNNNNSAKEGGSHWSLLVYNLTDNVYYHFDPMHGMNNDSANKLTLRLAYFQKKIPNLITTNCPQQNNNHDCGPYTLMFTEKVIDRIIEGSNIINIQIKDYEAKEIRAKLRKKIEEEIDPNSETSKDSEKTSEEQKTGRNKAPSINNKDKKEQKEEQKTQCWFFINRQCKFGDRCRNDHPDLCISMIENGKCSDNYCKLAHPKMCSSMYYKGYCNRRNCWFTHPTKPSNRNLRTNTKNAYNTKLNRNQNGWTKNHNHSNPWNQSNLNKDSNQINVPNRNFITPEPFLEQWPTPVEANSQMRVMLGRLLEKMANQIITPYY